jgi:hypothetical protein
VGPPFAAGEGGSKAEESGAGGREEVFRFHNVTVRKSQWGRGGAKPVAGFLQLF